MTERKPPGISWETWADRQIREAAGSTAVETGAAGPRRSARHQCPAGAGRTRRNRGRYSSTAPLIQGPGGTPGGPSQLMS